MKKFNYGHLLWFGTPPVTPEPKPYLLGWNPALANFKPFGLPVKELASSSRADVDFVASIQAMIDAVPADILSVVRKFGMAVLPVADLYDVISWLPYLGPGGTWEKRTQWDTVSGVCLFDGHLSVVARNYREERGYYKAENRQGVFNHELGHGFDAAFEYISQTREFLECVAADIEKLDRLNQRIYAYLLQSMPTGPSEIFAECFAAILGMCAVPSWTKDMPVYFPESFGFVKRLVDDLSSALPPKEPDQC
ncbi:MAG: hypothetical protein KGS72_25885 [Cyanobacteria bacterium REEB67]|nr:hypothetical protein [Cyanobacteria bacterium REEB67]